MRKRLPTSDKDRKTLLENIASKAVLDAALGIKYILDDTLIAITAFLLIFDAAIKLVEEKLKHRMDLVAVQNTAFDKLHEYLMDFIKGARARIYREEQPKANLQYYGMNQEGEIPVVQSMDEIKNLTETVLNGEARAVADGNAPMANPSAAELQAKYDDALARRDETEQADTLYDNAQAALAEHRKTAEGLIEDSDKQLEFALYKLDDASIRRIMRSYGFKFESEPGEEPSAKPVNFFVVWDPPNVHISCDPVPDAEGYLVQYSEDQENWVQLYDGQAESYTYQPPAGLSYYRMRAYNEYGDGEWSDVASFEPPEVPE